MIVRFLRDNWVELGPKTRAAISGAGAAMAVVLGSALLQLDAGEAIDWREWLHTLLIAEAGALGSGLLGTRRIDPEKVGIRHQADVTAIREFVARVNAHAEADMQRTGVLEGAHHRAIEAELAALHC